MPRAPKPKLAVEGPSALPSTKARAVAFLAVLVSGLCGLLIGRSLVDVQCRGDCDVAMGLGALAGAVFSAGGVAVVAALVLRAMSEWKAKANDPS